MAEWQVAACEWIFASPDLAGVLARLRAAGCVGVEISGEPRRRDRASLRDALAAAGLRATGTTSVCRWPTTERDLAHPDADARRRAVDYYRGCVDLAREVGAPVVGLIPASVGRVEHLSDPEAEWELAVAATREVALYAGEHGIAVGIEAINRYESCLVNTAEHALAFADAAGTPNVGVILDAFHMQLEEDDPAAAVRAAAPHLLALHLADTTRHGLGHGRLDVARLLSAAGESGYAGPLVLEFTAPGPNPFQADKGPEAMARLDGWLHQSVAAIHSAPPPPGGH